MLVLGVTEFQQFSGRDVPLSVSMRKTETLMNEATNGISSAVEQLGERVRELERRVAALENQPDKAASVRTVVKFTTVERPKPPDTWRGFPTPQTPSSVPVIGKAILGIAGAYLLRAVAESGAIPKLPVLLVAIVYACLWLVRAVRLHAASLFAAVTYAVTSALILSPMLWETTVRFQVLSPTFTGAVLVGFVVLASALAWRENLQLISWVATLFATLTALALTVATHALVPLTLTLLMIALVTEIAACFGRQLTVRAVPALACDIVIWLLVDVLASSTGVPEGYRPASRLTIAVLSLALLAIYGASIAVRSFWLRRRITVFEMVQGVLAFVIASFCAIRATHGSIVPALDGFFLLLSAACYWGALFRFTDKKDTRNRRVYATWAAALLIAGTLFFPHVLQVLFLCAAALASAFAYVRTDKFSLGLHVTAFLLAAAIVSPFPAYVLNALSGSAPPAPPWSVWLVAIVAAVCYATGSPFTKNGWKLRMLWLVPSLLTSLAVAGLAIGVIVWLASGHVEVAASRLSVVRTIVICALALSLGSLTSRWNRRELGWVAYAAVAFGTLKMLFEDLRLGNPTSLVFSLLFYGLILILLPKLMSRRRAET